MSNQPLSICDWVCLQDHQPLAKELPIPQSLKDQVEIKVSALGDMHDPSNEEHMTEIAKA